MNFQIGHSIEFIQFLAKTYLNLIGVIWAESGVISLVIRAFLMELKECARHRTVL